VWKEFKAFALKGNVVDLAVGVIIGGAFGKIVSSLVSDIIMPLLGALIGNNSLNNLFITLGKGKYATIEAAKEAGVATLNYGLFLNNILDFLIIAFSIFIVIKQLSRFTRKKEEPVVVQVTTKVCGYCFSEIHKDASRCPHCTSVLEK
jgi:large conductance mechanosensitive channel